MVFLGYKEHESLSTTGVRRREWRAVRCAEIPAAEIAAYYDWPPLPHAWVLQERQVCTGESYPGIPRNEFDWRIFGCATTYGACLGLLPGDATPAHPDAEKHLARRARRIDKMEAEYRANMEAERMAKMEAERAARELRESNAAFLRLAESKREAWSTLAASWNATVSSRGEELRARLRADSGLLGLYHDVMNATSVPDKARTIKAFLGAI